MPTITEVSQDDLVLVSDSGDIYVVKMQADLNGRHQPNNVGPLDPSLQTLPATLRDDGVSLAIMPEGVDTSGGVTCYLLNLQSVASALHPQASPTARVLVQVASALRGLWQQGEQGSIEIKIKGQQPRIIPLPTLQKQERR
jgi:hypothetical protein